MLRQAAKAESTNSVYRYLKRTLEAAVHSAANTAMKPYMKLHETI